MSKSDELLAELIKLPIDERRVLIKKAIESMPTEEVESWTDDPEFLAELDRRSGDLEGAIPWEKLRERLRRGI